MNIQEREVKIAEKLSNELEAVEKSVDYVANKMNEADATTFKVYWAKTLSKYNNYRFLTELTDKSQMYRLKWNDIKDAEVVSNIEYIARIVSNDRKNGLNLMSAPCKIEEVENGLSCKGLPLMVAGVSELPQHTSDDKYPVLITLMPDDTYIVIDGNHRVRSGDREAIIVSTATFIQSLISMYEILLFLLDINRCDYIKGKSMDKIIDYNERVISRICKLRNIK
jgi:hypothetical protein